MGDLQRMTQFKDKSQQHIHNINVGLFNYPVLMAADVLVYKATKVPVGEDQVQHLELSREICRKFNSRFGDIFPEPAPILSQAQRILGLDGKAKMSKSMNNYISLDMDAETLWNHLRGAFTDPQRLRKSDPGRPEICNIFTLHGFFTPEEKRREIERDCRSARLGCFDCKKILTDNIVAHLTPIQERKRQWQNRLSDVKDILTGGADRSRKVASETLAEVRQAMGLR
jgi:tryptophanyl-tRNA synthetase